MAKATKSENKKTKKSEKATVSRKIAKQEGIKQKPKTARKTGKTEKAEAAEKKAGSGRKDKAETGKRDKGRTKKAAVKEKKAESGALRGKKTGQEKKNKTGKPKQAAPIRKLAAEIKSESRGQDTFLDIYADVEKCRMAEKLEAIKKSASNMVEEAETIIKEEEAIIAGGQTADKAGFKIAMLKNEEEKKIAMWSGVILVMVVIVAIWAYNLKNVINATAKTKNPEAALNVSEITDSISGSIGEMKDQLAKIKELSSEMAIEESLAENAADSAAGTAESATGTAPEIPVVINQIKETLENKAASSTLE